MAVWDRGHYTVHEWTPTKVQVTLDGARARGRYALFQTRGKNWMIHRMDPPEDPERDPPPADIRPMLATLTADLPHGDAWAFEMKWDGARALALVQGGRVRLTSRNGNDVSAAYPELRAPGRALGATELMLDGEIVAIGEDGRASFELLQQRMHVRDASAVRRRSERVPVVFMIFDVVWKDGHLLTRQPYRERRRVLESLAPHGPAWQVPPSTFGDGVAALHASVELGFEGVVAKRLDSVYEPGRRSAAWLKVKNQLRQEFVVGGWLEGEGNRAGRIGALLIGYYDRETLHYAGRVGTGFTSAELDRLAALVADHERPDNPFAGAGVPRHAHFVDPVLVAEVRFGEWTSGGIVRHPAYLGLRDDKASTDVTREQ
jgi:bifunctional non-homologous end joining protein LigD